MKHYELTYLISSKLSEEEAKQLQTKITSLIQEKGGILVKENLPLKKKLAFPIEKQWQAYLTVVNFQLSPEKLIELEKNLKSEKQILRHIVLGKKETKTVRPVRKTQRLPRKTTKPKVELKEIEKKLEEILGNSQ